MRVFVKLYANLRKSVSENILSQYPGIVRSGTPVAIDLQQDSTLTDLIKHLGLPNEQVKITFVNGRARQPDYVLEPEDQVGIFPPIGGG